MDYQLPETAGLEVEDKSTKENDLSYAIRGAAFKVHTELGPGLLESVYEAALSYELSKSGFEIKNQVGVQ